MSFPEQVSAVSPLEGDAIDGTPRPKPRRERKPPRERMDASLTFFCRNPQCDHATWSPREQATHMHQEFWEVAQALIRLAPDSPQALRLTGGVVLRDLTDDDCRRLNAEYERNRRNGQPQTLAPHLGRMEFRRRRRSGELTPTNGYTRWVSADGCSKGHEWNPENTRINADGSRSCRRCGRERARERYQRDPAYRKKQQESARRARLKARAA